MLLGKRTNSRILSLQYLYLFDSVKQVADINNLIEWQSEEDFNLSKYDEELYCNLTKNVKDNIEDFDKIISQHINKNWNLSRIDKVVINIIRIAICELIYHIENSSNIIIDEYTTITSYFANSQEVDFVNAILEKISAAIRK